MKSHGPPPAKHHELNNKIKMEAVVDRAARIFGISIALKLLTKIALFRLKLPRALMTVGVWRDILKFAAANVSVSVLFLLSRIVIGKIRELLGLVQAKHGKDVDVKQTYRKLLERVDMVELFVSGCTASIGARLYDSSDLNLIKVLVYMRGVQGALILIKMILEHSLNKVYSLTSNLLKEQGDSMQDYEPIKLNVPHAGFVLGSFCIMTTVFAIYYESYAVPKGINARIMDLV